jgi:hypothetical protein
MKDLNIFKKVYKFYNIGIFSDDPLEERKFYLTNLKLRFEPCVLIFI